MKAYGNERVISMTMKRLYTQQAITIKDIPLELLKRSVERRCQDGEKRVYVKKKEIGLVRVLAAFLTIITTENMVKSL